MADVTGCFATAAGNTLDQIKQVPTLSFVLDLHESLQGSSVCPVSSATFEAFDQEYDFVSAACPALQSHLPLLVTLMQVGWSLAAVGVLFRGVDFG